MKFKINKTHCIHIKKNFINRSFLIEIHNNIISNIEYSNNKKSKLKAKQELSSA